MRILFLILSLYICGIAKATTYYVSPTGNDANPGTITLPFKNIQKLNSVMNAGDIAYIRGGTYTSTFNSASAYHLFFNDLIGTSGSRIEIQNYPGETVIMDFDAVGVPTTCYTYGVLLQGCRYLTLKGITFKNLRQTQDGCGVSRGMSLTESNFCIIENVEIYNMGGTGMVLENSDDNLILNCDSHHNGDGRSDNGNDAWDNADGFAIDGNSAIPIINTSERNTFRYCRTWINSDDGFEFFGVNGVVYVEGCWAMANGIKPWGTSNTNVTPGAMTSPDSAVWFNNSAYWSGGPGSASGEGYKLGESFDESVQNTLIHPMKNCLAFNNRGAGYASNSLDLHGLGPVTGIHQLWNCVAYSNGNDGFSFGAGWCVTTSQRFKNCWSWNNNKGTGGADWVYDGNNSSAISNNVWPSIYQGVNYGNLYPTIKVSSADFISVSSIGTYGPRQADGSLPVLNFLRLAPSSDLIDKGTNVGLPFSGSNPDVGAYEFSSSANTAPIANANINQTIILPINSISLSGSGTDPDGTIASYFWTRIAGPTGGTITNSTSAATTVTGLIQGVYQFELTVTDDDGAFDSDTMEVTVNPAIGNQIPSSNAGNDQAITLPSNSVNLTGSGTDPDGIISGYVWTKVSGPASGTITNSTAATTSITGMSQGVYKFELKVFDNNAATDTDTIQVTVNAAPNQSPSANAGNDQDITLPTNSVSLSGSGTDPDGTIAAYRWRKVSGPTTFTITNTTSATTTVTGLVQGIYRFELRVTDNIGATDFDTMQVTVNPAPNQAPAANAGSDQNITLPVNSVSLNGSGTDPDGTISSYLWTKISGPTGGTITNTTSASTSATGMLQGVYQYQLTVTDNDGATDTDIIQVTVSQAVNQAPAANAGLDQNITLPVNSISLNGSGTDPDGTISSYLWTKISGPTGGTITNSTAATTSVTALTQGIYRFVLRVTDNSGATDTDTMQVTVNPAVNQAPAANAGLDQNITLPVNSISLNGSGTDPDGTISSYLWTKISGPTGGTITNSTAATTSVTALTLGIYKFVLRVTDNSGATDTDTMQVTVNPAVNQAPAANAGLNQTITLPVNSVSLNGSGTDPDGTISSYLWTKISGPTGGTITSSTSASTSATGMVQGVYQYQLTVTDNNGATDTDIMQVNVNAAPPPPNQAPAANAGLDQNITLPVNSISLNGSGTDPDGSIAAYRWRKISGPTTFTITNTTSATTTVTGLVQGIYKFELRVTDNSGATDTDTMQVTVNPAVNQLPTANAGLDQTITLPVNSVTLNGSGTDPDGSISSYLWTKISGPTGGTLTNSTTATTSVTALTQGVYKFVLRVTDNSGATDTDTMQVTVNPVPNQSPAANAGVDQNITLPVNTVTLTGIGTDPDGNITAYSWVKISGPANGNISNASAATTTVNGLVQGVYQFELTVTDNNGASDTDIMQVIVNPVPNQAPSANAGLDQNITLPVNSVSLNGIGVDPDGTISAYRWRKISGPTTFTITNTNSATTTVTALVQGVYKFELRVTDNNGATGFDTMQVTVNQAINQLPTANAGLDQSITLPINTISLSGSGTDPDGTISSYLWTKISGPAAGTISSSTSAATLVTGLVEGIYRFELKVTDNSGATDTDTMLVIVNAAPNQAPTAEAGLNQSITLPVNTVTLSGSGTDPDGTISSYSWVQISGPAGAAISNSNDASTAVTGLVQGVYQFELTVTDNDGATDTDIMQVNVNAALPPPNQSPTAIAGTDQNITLPTNSVLLDGIGIDPDGTISAYRWRKISGPTTYTISNTTSARTTVTGLVQGIYQFELRVTDNNGATGFDTMQVTVNQAANQLPTANAGLDQNITLPVNSVSLSGSATDPDGNITTYLWSKISGPANGTITNATTAITSVTGLEQGVYNFQLRVTDNNGAADTDTIQVTVNPALNQAPTAEAGLNQTITLPVNTVTLSGSGTDPDGTISSYSWVKISGPASGTITNTTAATTTVTGMVQGIYQFELTVTDNNGATDTDIMQVNVNAAPPPSNQAPTANAGQDQVITLPVNTVSLSGTGNDPDGTIAAYRWRSVSGPTTYTIINTTTAATTVTGLVQGVYQFELRVTDNNGTTGFDTMQVTVNEELPPPNLAPNANAGTDTIIYLPTNSVLLSGMGNDPDGNIVSYQWNVISGISYSLTNAGNANSTLSDLQQGIYEIELTVTDNNGATGKDTVTITVGAGRLQNYTNDVTILGNPVQDILTARITSNSENRLMKIVLYNINGVLLYEKSFKQTQYIQLKEIDMTRYSKGTYILQVYFDKVTPVTKKVIKM